ncbi:MAG: uroporphyrinogen decarboxylase family protein, partial [Spirochaetia bacterium]|nr:uroporphyrinogen decarboxylase family protein [Spirochaetia bacterium]
ALSYYEDLTYRISANAIRTAMGSDCVIVGGTVREGFVPKPVNGDISENEFGMHMKPTPLYMEVVRCPLAEASTVEDIEKYDFPDAYAPGRFVKAKRDIAQYKNDYFIIGDCELSIFELAWHLTGMQEYMMAMAMEEPWIGALNDKVEAWTLGLARQLVEAGVDAIWFGEDLGTQTSMLISPDMWRAEFKPRYARMIEELKKINPAVLYIIHSDGAVAPLVDDFVEIGFSVYNPVQPNVPGSDPEELNQKYGDRIAFFGGIDQQVLLPSGDVQALRKEIKRRYQLMGLNGNYLMAPAHIIQADVAPEMVVAMIDAIKAL